MESASKTTLWNKSLVTNLISGSVVVLGLLLPAPWSGPILSVGLFALSGAITNWLAIHMLFEKVPGLYGSGIIPERFEEFKGGIQKMVMEQFFNSDMVDRFFGSSSDPHHQDIELDPVIDQIDLSPAFDSLVATVKESPFAGMLSMIGGEASLQTLREPFYRKMRAAIKHIAHTETFQNTLKAQISGGMVSQQVADRLEEIVQSRLDELTPQMVKDIVQEMIREHLGWLVIWGGVFGGILGLLAHWVR